MSDDSVRTIQGTFSTREAAERAIEHLVQEYGIDRADVFVQASGDENTVGTEPAGADLPQGEGATSAPPLEGQILVSADVDTEALPKAEAAFRDAGAEDVVTR